MITIIKDSNPNHIFAALKLCEQLYHDGKIPLYMFRNMVNSTLTWWMPRNSISPFSRKEKKPDDVSIQRI